MSLITLTPNEKVETVSEILNITSMFARLMGQGQFTATFSDLLKHYRLVITQSDEHKKIKVHISDTTFMQKIITHWKYEATQILKI